MNKSDTLRLPMGEVKTDRRCVVQLSGVRTVDRLWKNVR